jgi:hypothetical protein
MGLGTVEALTIQVGVDLVGINDWGDAGSSVKQLFTGIAMTAALGTPTEITGDATIVANTLNVAQVNFRRCRSCTRCSSNWKLYDRCFRNS